MGSREAAASGSASQTTIALLLLALSLALLTLWRSFPFAFYSPDGSFHAAKLLRASEGDPFRDPFSGTPSLYPAAFHWSYGTLNRVLRLDPLPLYRLAGVLNFSLLFAAFFACARSALGHTGKAAVATLLLPLLFYAPTGRHILVVNPANFALPILLFGAAALLASLGGSRRTGLLGLAALSLAANAVWYLGLPALACVIGYALVVRPEQRPVWWKALAALVLPGLVTVAQFLAIRDVLGDYTGFVSGEWGRQGGGALDAGLVRDWLEALVTKGNTRFLPALERSLLQRVHYDAVLVFAAAVGAGVVGRAREIRREPAALRFLLLSAVLTLFFSLGLAITRDFPRVVSVQFVAWVLFAFAALRAAWLWESRGGHALLALFAALGIVGLAATVRHTGRPFEAAPPAPTRAVVALIAALPDHAGQRIFVSEAHLRELAPFVTFESFVNHGDGRYYAQDPKSSARLLAAYRTIRDRSEGWREALHAEGVRYLIFHHRDGGAESEAGLFYLGQGSAVLQNPEWWVVEMTP